jgi:DNA invertase Pin-like site-specific DNA recombinase
MMNGEHKITDSHRARKAIVYLRQSSEGQVKHNKESQELQYGMVSHAHELGFHNVEIMDNDLGSSAAPGARKREDFELLLVAVALGTVGLILSLETSRLSRTDKDWCQLMELCQFFDTLIGDAENIYDISRLDDQLVLGFKATMSVIELNTIKKRMLSGQENKAKKGELYRLLPPGYVFDASRRPVKDPNARVQEAITSIFTKFQEICSIRQTFKWFRDHKIELPVNKSRAGYVQVVFQPPSHSFVKDVLQNAFYAGAYVYGRRTQAVVWKNGVLIKRQGRVLAPEEARVFLRDHHEGYIDWETYQENQRTIRQNNMHGESDSSVGLVRCGQGLLVGLLRCGRCGRKIYVRYWGKSGTSVRYLCSGNFNAGGSYCIGFGGRPVDKRFGEEIVSVISPLGIQASLEAIKRVGTEEDTQRKALQRQLEQLEYEAALAFDQYNEVDPRNRLVAAELERRWNEKLQEVEYVRSNLGDRSSNQITYTDGECQKLIAFGERFTNVWYSESCPIEMKKKIVRLIIKEIIVDEKPPGTLSFIIHWIGGVHTTLEIPKPSPLSGGGETAMEDLEIIQKMAVKYGDDMIARVLNRLGRCTGKGNIWNQHRVYSVRKKHGIKGQRRTNNDPKILSLQGAARYLGVSNTTVTRLVESGILPMKQVVPWAPWEILILDLDSERVQNIVDNLKKTGKLVIEGDTLKTQGTLF